MRESRRLGRAGLLRGLFRNAAQNGLFEQPTSELAHAIVAVYDLGGALAGEKNEASAPERKVMVADEFFVLVLKSSFRIVGSTYHVFMARGSKLATSKAKICRKTALEKVVAMKPELLQRGVNIESQQCYDGKMGS
jgi:hypothetical protein